MLPPVQTDTSGPAFATGIGFTVTTTASVDVQLLADVVTVKVYVTGDAVVFVNVTVGFDTVLLLNPVAGDHE